MGFNSPDANRAASGGLTMARVVKTYDFPNATIQRLADGRYIEFFKWCSSVKVERDRSYVSEALRLLRRFRRMAQAARRNQII